MKQLMRAFLFTAVVAACGEDGGTSQPDVLALPGAAYYPESLAAGDDGTLFVGSLTTGQVVAFDDGATEPRVVVGEGRGVTGVAGVLVRGDTLWLCSVDTTFARANELRSFSLAGAPRAAYPLDAGRFCNDLAFDAAGNLYVTDSFSGTILRLRAGDDALEPWLVDPALAPTMAGAFGLDGIAIAGTNLYVNRFDTGALYRVPIGEDGRAGAAAPIAVTPALASPDGMRIVADDTLLLVEGAGRLTRLALDGDTATATTLAELDTPTSVVEARGAAWVTEGQLPRLFGGEDPRLPFAVRRVALD